MSTSCPEDFPEEVYNPFILLSLVEYWRAFFGKVLKAKHSSIGVQVLPSLPN